jgi:hypothetical protein
MELGGAMLSMFTASNRIAAAPAFCMSWRLRLAYSMASDCERTAAPTTGLVFW